MRWPLPLLLVATLLAGCGGDDDYVERMEAACDERDRSFEALVQPVPAEFTPEYIDLVVRGSVDIIAAYLDEVRNVGLPGGELDDEHRRYVGLLEDALERYEDAAGDAARSAEVFNQPAPDFAEVEAALGLETCGQPGNGLEDGGGD